MTRSTLARPVCSFNVLFFFVERKMEDRDKRKRQKELAELSKQPRKLRRRA